jgi:hypothetical protein
MTTNSNIFLRVILTNKPYYNITYFNTVLQFSQLLHIPILVTIVTLTIIHIN